MIENLSFDKITIDDISFFFQNRIKADVLRLDKLHPVISGNKWFKLRFYLSEAIANDCSTIVTFGGAWSNHIIAVAAAAKMNRLNSIGIIRGEAPKKLSVTLEQAKELGMQFHFLSREAYRQKLIPEGVMNDRFFLIPEGGYGRQGTLGAATILDHLSNTYTHICCAVGTGTMLAGMLNKEPASQFIGISSLKGNPVLEDSIRQFLNNREQSNFTVFHDYHWGGYAKTKPALFDFMNNFYNSTGIPSDIIYTGKLFFAIHDLFLKNYFPAGSRLLIIHSGGLQGNASLPAGVLHF